MGATIPSSQSGLLNQSSAQVIDGSLKLNSALSQVLTRTPAVERNRKTWTFSFWIKLFQNSQTILATFGLSGGGGSQTGLDIRFNAAFQLAVSNQVNNSNAWSLVSTAVHRDTGWYHVVIAHDTTQSVETDRLKMYVNGKQITSFQTSSYPTLNYESSANKALPHRIGSWDDNGSIYAPMEGMLSNVYMIEGKSLGPGYFGSTDPLTGTWRPRKASADFRILGSGLIYSSYGSGTVSGVKGYTRAFDGNLSLFCEPNDNSTITFDFTSLPGGGITVGSSLRMYLNKAGTPAAGHFTVNGTNLGGSVPSGGWLTINSVSRLDTITFYHQSGSSSVELYAVEIDGVVLVDGTATKTTVNDGTQWSSLVDVSNATVNNGSAANLFDGDTTTKINITAGYIEIDLSSRNVHAGPEGIEVYNNEGGAYTSYQVNGGTAINWQASAGWMSMGGANSKINTIRINHLSGGGVNAAFAFKVNGVIMRDSTTQKLDFGPNGFYLPMDGNSSIGEDKSGKGNDWTSVNFSGFTTLDKATGALPILNTVSGGNYATVGVRTDSNYSNLVLALPLVGSANDVSNSVNSGSTTKAVTSNGNAAASSTQSNFYGGSYYFDGNGDYLTTDLSSVSLGSAYTIEFWWNKAGTQGGNHGHFCLNGTHGTQTIAYREAAATGTSSNDFYIDLGGSFVAGLITETINTGQWNHFAFVHEGSGVFKSYLNGVLQTTKTVGTTGTMGTTTSIGGGIGTYTTQFVNGYISDYRIYQAAKYTSNFVVASSSPDIFPDTPSGVSGSSKLSKITDGSVAFDGNGDYLVVSNNSDIVFEEGSFTIECFVYAKSYNSVTYPTVISKYDDGDTSWILRYKSDGDVVWYAGQVGGGTNNESTTQPIRLNSWQHVAVVREGTGSNQTKVYFDGQLVLTCTDTSDYDDTNDIYIGRQDSSNANEFDGFISNVRILKGTALYTSDFTPPISPLTNVTNTKLLCCQSNTSATEGAVKPGTITANGNAAATTFNPFNFDTNTVHGNPSNYCTWNPLFIDAGGTNNRPCNLSNGNLTAESPNSGDWNIALGTVQVSRGKYYWELTHLQGNLSCMMGVIANTNGGMFNSNSGFYYNPLTWTYYLSTGNKRNGSASGTSYGTAGVNGDVIGVAIDLDKGTISISKNGVSMGVMYDNLPAGEEFTAIWGASKQSTTNQVSANFGQKPFKYAPPEGHGTLSSAGARKETVIARPDQYVSATIYTGNGATSPGGSGGTQSIDVKHKPDFIWIKDRTQDHNHNLVDTIRGANSILMSDSTTTPVTNSTDAVTAFTDTGFTLGDNGEGTQSLELNKSGNNYVVWSWKAGGDQPISDLVFGVNTDDNGFDSSGTSRTYDTTGFTFGSYTTPQSHPGGTYGANSAQIYKSSSGKLVKWSVSTSTADKYIWTSSDGINWSSVGSQYDTDGAPKTVTSKQIALSGGANAASLTVTGSHAFNVDDVGYASAAAAGLTAGTITPTGCSVGTKQGFSIITFTAQGSGSATVGHGLGKKPAFWIYKPYANTTNWYMYHQSLGASAWLNFTTGEATTGNAAAWGGVEPTSTVLTHGSGLVNQSSCVIYAWCDVPGLQKFGSYEGIQNADGPFVELGFRPALIWVKNIDSGAGHWVIVDNKRDPYNPVGTKLAANLPNADYLGGSFREECDFLSNGFKMKGTSTDSSGMNKSDTYIYCAWAESPTVNLFGGQSNAR